MTATTIGTSCSSNALDIVPWWTFGICNWTGDLAAAGAWLDRGRDRLYAVLERRLQGRRDQRHIRLLQEVEEKHLEAAGLNTLTAHRKARRIAKAMVVTAGQWREEQRLLDATDRATGPHGPTLVERLSVAGSQPEPVLEPHETQRHALLRRLDSWIGMLLGRGLRFWFALALLTGLAIWLDSKGIMTGMQVREQAIELHRVVRRAARLTDLSLLRDLRWNLSIDWRRLGEPLDLPGLEGVLGRTLPGTNFAVAAAILLLSLFSGRRITGFLAIAGTAVTLFGPRWGLAAPLLLAHINNNAQAMALGVLIMLVGWFWPGRKSTGIE